ncbi:MAG: hypothetical protein Q7T92_12620 [Lutibacter sp.]|nr:hypothetical protein [Lutibacter sp.]
MKNLKTALVIVSVGLYSLTAFSCKNTEKNDVQRNETPMEMSNDTMQHADDENMPMNHQDSETDKTTNEE